MKHFLNNKKLYYIKVACGEDFTLILDECGKLWGCGQSKFLPHVQGIGNDGKIDLPVMILEKFKFKYVSAKGNLASAITMNGEMYCWGEMIVEDTVKKIDFAQVSNERMKICSVGFNHCGQVTHNHCDSWVSSEVKDPCVFLFCTCRSHSGFFLILIFIYLAALVCGI